MLIPFLFLILGCQSAPGDSFSKGKTGQRVSIYQVEESVGERISDEFKENHKKLEKCLTHSNKEIVGIIVVWELSKDGHITSANATKADSKEKGFNECLINQIKNLQFKKLELPVRGELQFFAN